MSFILAAGGVVVGFWAMLAYLFRPGVVLSVLAGLAVISLVPAIANIMPLIDKVSGPVGSYSEAESFGAVMGGGYLLLAVPLAIASLLGWGLGSFARKSRRTSTGGRP